jgi:hypothetical protein
MKLGVLTRIDASDIKKAEDSPGWLNLLIDPLNQIIENIVKAMSNNLTFVDNFSCVQVSVKIQNAVEFVVTPQTPRKVLTVLLLEANGYQVSSFGWTRKADGKIGLTASFIGSPTGQIDSKFLILTSV